MEDLEAEREWPDDARRGARAHPPRQDRRPARRLAAPGRPARRRRRARADAAARRAWRAARPDVPDRRRHPRRRGQRRAARQDRRQGRRGAQADLSRRSSASTRAGAGSPSSRAEALERVAALPARRELWRAWSSTWRPARRSAAARRAGGPTQRHAEPGAARSTSCSSRAACSPAREQARRAVMAGQVRVDGSVVDKAGAARAATTPSSRSPRATRSSRAPAASSRPRSTASRSIPPAGLPRRRRLDRRLHRLPAAARGARASTPSTSAAASSTGGCARTRGWSCMEGINARHLAADALPEPLELVTVDVSFISLLKVVPALLPHLRPGGAAAGAGQAAVRGRPRGGGQGRHRARRGRCAAGHRASAWREIAALGLAPLGVMDSPVRGAEGNVEALALFRRQARWPAGSAPCRR